MGEIIVAVITLWAIVMMIFLCLFIFYAFKIVKLNNETIKNLDVQIAELKRRLGR